MTEDRWRLAVDIARRILSLDLGMIEGCRELMLVREHCDLYDFKELDAFVGVESETDRLPIGAARAQWTPEALAEADREIEQNVAFYRGYIDEACRRLIAKFG